jgi:hypothetical protein
MRWVGGGVFGGGLLGAGAIGGEARAPCLLRARPVPPWGGAPRSRPHPRPAPPRSLPPPSHSRPDGPPSMAVNPISSPSAFFGCSPHFGFTKPNELLHGRLAMLGFVAALINETQTGLGPIGQVGGGWGVGARCAQAGSGAGRFAGVAGQGALAATPSRPPFPAPRPLPPPPAPLPYPGRVVAGRPHPLTPPFLAPCPLPPPLPRPRPTQVAWWLGNSTPGSDWCGLDLPAAPRNPPRHHPHPGRTLTPPGPCTPHPQVPPVRHRPGRVRPRHDHRGLRVGPLGHDAGRCAGGRRGGGAGEGCGGWVRGRWLAQLRAASPAAPTAAAWNAAPNPTPRSLPREPPLPASHLQRTTSTERPRCSGRPSPGQRRGCSGPGLPGHARWRGQLRWARRRSSGRLRLSSLAPREDDTPSQHRGRGCICLLAAGGVRRR